MTHSISSVRRAIRAYKPRMRPRVASSVFLPNIEIPTRYSLESFNLSGYIGMVVFVEVVFTVEGYRGRLKSVWLECMAALAGAMLITYPIWWIVRIP